MNPLQKSGAALVALSLAALPVPASAACLNRTDMHAMQAAALQQRLMVAAFTCHDTAAYNRFVLGHRSDLQKSDATLLAYFQKNGGTAGYHTYKTHLANAASLESSRNDDFCGNTDSLFRATSGHGSLDAILDRMPTTGTGYAACYVADASPVRGESQRVMADSGSVPPPSSEPSRRLARSRLDRDDEYADSDDDGPPPSWRDAPRGRYAERGNGPGWNSRDADDDSDEADWRDGPAYDDGPDDGPGW